MPGPREVAHGHAVPPCSHAARSLVIFRSPYHGGHPAPRGLPWRWRSTGSWPHQPVTRRQKILRRVDRRSTFLDHPGGGGSRRTRTYSAKCKRRPSGSSLYPPPTGAGLKGRVDRHPERIYKPSRHSLYRVPPVLTLAKWHARAVKHLLAYCLWRTGCTHGLVVLLTA